MTVYVDDMYLYPVGQFGRMKMSHCIADTQDELLAMMDRIGMRRKWIQHKGGPQEHFDICLSMRKAAIEAGAVPITMKQCSLMCRRRAVEGALGAPDDVQEWFTTLMAARRQSTPGSRT
ncbi:DUF4031 domain-containing protein [Cupriavidus metallidurans]